MVHHVRTKYKKSSWKSWLMVAANKADHIFVGCTFVFVNILLSWFSPSCRANETLKCDKTCIKKPSCSYFFKLNRSLILAWGNDFGIKQNYRNVLFPVKNTQRLPQRIFEGFVEGKVPLSHWQRRAQSQSKPDWFRLFCYDDFNY